MADVFSSKPYGHGPAHRSYEWAYAKILATLHSGKWISTNDCYQATKRKTKRGVIHAVLKQMIEENKIEMRTNEVTGGRPCTEFKLTVPNAELCGGEAVRTNAGLAGRKV